MDITLDEMITELGGTPPAPAPAAEPPTAEPPAEPTKSDPAPDTGASATEPTPPTPAAPVAEPKPDKAMQTAQTFAAMRVQNKKQADVLRTLASVFEIDPKGLNDDALLETLQAKAIEKQAATQNLPAPVLAELTQLRQLQSQQHTTEVAIGFQRVMDTYKITEAEVNQFAEDLIAKGINPLEQQIDLVTAYKTMHHEELVAKAVQEAIIAEQNRAAKASTQSTTPSSKQGAGGAGEPAKVSNVHELNTWLDNQTKK